MDCIFSKISHFYTILHACHYFINNYMHTQFSVLCAFFFPFLNPYPHLFASNWSSPSKSSDPHAFLLLLLLLLLLTSNCTFSDLHQIIKSSQALSNDHCQYFLFQVFPCYSVSGMKFLESMQVEVNPTQCSYMGFEFYNY